MPIDWWQLEQRKPPGPQDIKKAVAAAGELPDAGDHGHVMAPWDVTNELPVIEQGAWDEAQQKTVKIKKLKATTMRLKRDDLIWHIQNPGKSRFHGQWNTHIQVAQDKNDDLLIIDGHHRAAALMMLGVKKEIVWLLKL